ncbi:MAG: hypothetical protein ABI572_06895 [Actinomycetota bacterium]
MGYVIVVLLAVLAGGSVYWASMRFAVDHTAGSEPGADSRSEDDGGSTLETRERRETGEPDARPPVPAPGMAYIPVVSSRGSWQGRLSGAMGLVIAVVVAAATTAFVLYEAGHLISSLVGHAANAD